MKADNGWIRRRRDNRPLVIAALGMLLLAMVPPPIAGGGEKPQVHLYFADARNSFLIAEARAMVHPDDPGALARQILHALIGGSSDGNLPTIPPGTKLRSFFLLDDGTAVVDFSRSFRENHPGGCRMEQLTLFSVVNSMILNVPEIKQVKILVDGTEGKTLAGHLALDFPLTADMLLTR